MVLLAPRVGIGEDLLDIAALEFGVDKQRGRLLQHALLLLFEILQVLCVPLAMLDRVGINGIGRKQPVAVPLVLCPLLDLMDQRPAQNTLHVVAHLYDIGRLEGLVNYVKFASELLYQLLCVRRITDPEIIWDAPGVKVRAKLLDPKLAILALIIFYRPVLAPVILIFEKDLLEAILINVGLVLPVGLRVRCFVSITCGVLRGIVVLQAGFSEADVPEHIAFGRITLNLLIRDYRLRLRDLDSLQRAI